MAVLTSPKGPINIRAGETRIIRCLYDELHKMNAVKVEEDSVTINPKYMTTGQFYFAEIKGEPFLYRKVSEHEVEIYGLAE